jgi:hypothetical protein
MTRSVQLVCSIGGHFVLRETKPVITTARNT